MDNCEEVPDMSSYRILSSDDHVIEPADLWTSRVEPRFRDRVPHIERREDGDWWYCDGQRVLFAAGSQAGKRFEDPHALKITDDVGNVRAGGYIPEEHVKDMDLDGVDVSVLYPTVGLLAYNVPDSELLTAVCRTYNDWIADYCEPFPDRLKGVGMINIDDVSSGLEEMKRCAKMGLIGAMITVYPPEDRSYGSKEYEPLWAAAQELGMPLSLHVATNRATPGQERKDFKSPNPTAYANMSDHWVRLSLGSLIFSGVFERYPQLQVGSVEAESAWVPHFLSRMDYCYTQKPLDYAPYRYTEDMIPSDYFHRNVFVGFQEDAVGIRLRDLIGVDVLQWGSDYPHVESTFPRSRAILEEILLGCSAEEKAKIAGGNAARIYHFE